MAVRASTNSPSSVTSSTPTIVLKSPELQQQVSTSSFSTTMIQQQQHSATSTHHRVRRNITNKPMSMKGHLAKHKLPFWVRLVQGNLQKHIHSLEPSVQGPEGNSILGCEVPLQVLEIRRRKLVIARKMQWERKVQDYVVTGKNLQIPINFKGEWYLMIIIVYCIYVLPKFVLMFLSLSAYCVSLSQNW